MDIKLRYIQLFLDLNNSEKGLLGFSLPNKYNLTVSDVISFIMEYQKKGYITCDKEYRIKITDEGRKAVGLLYYRNIISESHKGSDYFDEMQSIDRVGINEPYLPKADFLSSGYKKTNQGEENEGN